MKSNVYDKLSWSEFVPKLMKFFEMCAEFHPLRNSITRYLIRLYM